MRRSQPFFRSFIARQQQAHQLIETQTEKAPTANEMPYIQSHYLTPQCIYLLRIQFRIVHFTCSPLLIRQASPVLSQQQLSVRMLIHARVHTHSRQMAFMLKLMVRTEIKNVKQMQMPKKSTKYLTRAHWSRKATNWFSVCERVHVKNAGLANCGAQFFFSPHHKQTLMHDMDDLAFVKSQKWFFFGCKSKLLHKWPNFSFTHIGTRPKTYEIYRMRRKKKNAALLKNFTHWRQHKNN